MKLNVFIFNNVYLSIRISSSEYPTSVNDRQIFCDLLTDFQFFVALLRLLECKRVIYDNILLEVLSESESEQFTGETPN